MTWVLAIGVGGLSAAVSHYADRRRPWWAQWWYGLWMVIDVIVSAILAAERDWGPSALVALCAVSSGWSWWKHRKNRKRKRAASLVGAKSRARIEALVRKTREAGQPRRVLRPVPGRTN